MNPFQIMLALIAIQWHKTWAAYLNQSTLAQIRGRGHADRADYRSLKTHEVNLQVAEQNLNALVWP